MRLTTGPSIGPILAVTIPTRNLGQIEACYSQFLGYRKLESGHLDNGLAEAWGAPALSQADYLIMGPAAGDDFVFRFVASPEPPPADVFKTYGWNAAEILVRDVDALAVEISRSPFEVVGEPANLSFSDDIRAMQVLGPAGELLYLTEFKKKLPGLDTPDVRCAVDRVFIMISGGPSIDALQSFYADRFGIEKAPVMESRVKGMSRTFGLSPEQRYPIAALVLNGQSFIEVDQMHELATARDRTDGLLPGGIAMVSFAGTIPEDMIKTQIGETSPPYCGQDSIAVTTGAAGELIEIIEPAA